MIINGVDTSGLSPVTEEVILPELVPGRTLHLDGDMLAYACAAFDDEPFARMKQTFMTALENRMAAAGAEFVHVHLTGGDKGGRFEYAVVKEYQANRKDKQKPQHLEALKAYVADKPFTTVHETQEADDGMAQANYAAIKAGTPELSVIMSGDKDLQMVSGWHCDWYTLDLEYVEGYGYTEIAQSGKTKKVVGKGTKFFWTQLLMGDSADNIPGLPKYLAPNGKLKACGPVAAFGVLEDCSNDTEAMLAVFNAYRDYYGEEPFEYKGWDGVVHEKMTYTKMLLEQARLLWMRRVQDPEDAVNFIRDVSKGGNWNGL